MHPHHSISDTMNLHQTNTLDPSRIVAQGRTVMAPPPKTGPVVKGERTAGGRLPTNGPAHGHPHHHSRRTAADTPRDQQTGPQASDTRTVTTGNGEHLDVMRHLALNNECVHLDLALSSSHLDTRRLQPLWGRLPQGDAPASCFCFSAMGRVWGRLPQGGAPARIRNSNQTWISVAPVTMKSPHLVASRERRSGCKTVFSRAGWKVGGVSVAAEMRQVASGGTQRRRTGNTRLWHRGPKRPSQHAPGGGGTKDRPDTPPARNHRPTNRS